MNKATRLRFTMVDAETGHEWRREGGRWMHESRNLEAWRCHLCGDGVVEDCMAMKHKACPKEPETDFMAMLANRVAKDQP